MPQKIKFRRGSQGDLNTIIPEDGEPCWANDTHKLIVGDGSSLGGIPVSNSIDSLTMSQAVTGVIESGSLVIESDGLKRLHYGNGTQGGIILNNGSFLRHDTNTLGRIIPDDSTAWFRHPVFYVSVEDATYYGIDAVLHLDVGQVSTGVGTPQMDFAVEGFNVFRGSATVIQNVSTSINNLSLTGIVHCAEITTSTISLPGTPSGTNQRSILHIKGLGISHNAGTTAPTGGNAVGIRVKKHESPGITMRIRPGGYLNVFQVPSVIGEFRYLAIVSGVTNVSIATNKNVPSGSRLYSESVFIGNPGSNSTTYFWRANGVEIPNQSGNYPSSGRTPDFFLTGYSSGTSITCLYKADSAYGIVSGETLPCYQST